MPSPFPGMDPYLEDPVFFHSIHQRLIAYLSEQLTAVLPEPYFAELEDRVWIEAAKPHQAVPDVNVLRTDAPSVPKGNGGVAVAVTTATEPLVIHVPHIEVSEWYANVYARLGDSEQIVTTIEVLSEANKTTGEKGRELYRRKQEAILSSKVHLVEIDLLRRGLHSTCVPLDRLEATTPDRDYHACVKQFDNVEDYFVYPIRLPDKLPVLAIPLLPGDGSVPLELQKAFDRAYDAGPYRHRVRYANPVPAPALSEQRAGWVKQVLRDKGLLPA